MSENLITTNFLYLTSSSFVTISHTNYWEQVNSWKNLWKFWNGPLCRNISSPFLLINVAAYWQSSNTEVCDKKLSQILANNIDNGGRRIGLRIYVRHCRFKKSVTRSAFGELQLTQISLNFKTSCCNLKIRGLGAKLWVAFL